MNTATVATSQMQVTDRSKDGAVATCQQMPLSFLKNGETALVTKVRGKGEMHHHLENLGFVVGARVTVMSAAAGDLIVQIKGTQVALDKQIASRIITNAAA